MAAELPPEEPPGVRSQIPRVARYTKQQVFGECGVAEFGRVGFADNDGAGSFQTSDLDRIFLRNVVLERHRAERRRHSCDILEIFNSKG